MARKPGPRVATANHLREGHVIYFAAPGWTRDIARADVARSDDEAEALLAAASRFPLEVVGVVLAEVDLSSGTPVPTHFREAFRARGLDILPHERQARDVSL